LTVTPQPEAFMTIASTGPWLLSPGSTSGHHASTLRRMSASPPSWSLRWLRIAPQQPAPSATSVWMPAASSTRAVALLTLGIIAGCTQPASISTRRGCSRVGQRRARTPRLAAGTLFFSVWGSSGRTAWPSFIAGPNRGEVRPSLRSQRTARSGAGRGTRSSTMRRPMSTSCPYCTPEGQVVSQLRQVRQRSRCCCVLRVTGAPSSTCLIR
jgi:hypothetical protein